MAEQPHGPALSPGDKLKIMEILAEHGGVISAIARNNRTGDEMTVELGPSTSSDMEESAETDD